MFLNILPKFINNIRPIFNQSRQILGITSSQIAQPTETIAGGSWSTIISRSSIRNHFPRAKETKRVKVHGWNKRMSTPESRRILMRRILKGRHVLSH